MAINTSKVIFACDESGAKGYANKDEDYPGEVGVFAGILIPDECLLSVSPKFQEIYNRYKPASGKLHITDLPDHLKADLRHDVYEAIREFRLPCFWYAIHVAGLHAAYLRMDVVNQNAREFQKKANTRIKHGSSRSEPVSMHVELFSGLYGHLIAFLEERKRNEVAIEIRTDQIDSPIVEEFEAFAKRLLCDYPTIKKMTGFDTVTQRVVDGSIKIEVTFPLEMQIKSVVRSLSINPVRSEDGLVLAADVLANSLNYLFKHRSDEDRYNALNTSEAVVDHPLAKHLDAFVDWGMGDLVGDCLYMHPKAQQT